MAVLAVVGHHRRLADVVIPIQSLWNWLLRERAVYRARGQADDYVLKFAKATVADEFAGEPEIAVAALLAADLKDALVVAHGFHEALAFVDGEGERLLAVNILAGLHREQVYKRVPVVGRARDDGVDVVALHELAKVLVRLRHLAVLRELLGSGFGMTVINVADGKHVTVSGRTRAVGTALAATTDQCDARTVVGTERLGLGGVGLFEFEEPSWHTGGGGEGSGGLDETAAIDVENFWCHGRIALQSHGCVKIETGGLLCGKPPFRFSHAWGAMNPFRISCRMTNDE